MKKDLFQKAGAVAKGTLLLLAVLSFSGCDDLKCIKGEGNVEQRTLQLQPFSEVDANGDFKVYITQGATQQVEVKGEPNILDQLNMQVRNGKWKIENEDCVRRSKTVEVYITMPEVEGLYLNGSGRIYGENRFDVTDLPVEVNGSGKIELELDADKVIAKVTGSGEMALSGTTEVESIHLSGSGTVAGFGLQAEDVTVNLSGSGKAEVYASSTLTVNVSGSGRVYYDGNPEVNTSISGSGKVLKR